LGDVWNRQLSKSFRTLRSKAIPLAVAAALLVVALAVAGFVLHRSRGTKVDGKPPLLPVTTMVHVRTSPPGAKVFVDGKERSSSDVSLEAGDHQFEAVLAGYAPARKTESLQLGSPLNVDLTLQPLDHTVRLTIPDLETGDASLDD